jgi:hypothetical protein
MKINKKSLIFGTILMLVSIAISGCIQQQNTELKPLFFKIENLTFDSLNYSEDGVNISSLMMLCYLTIENPNDEVIDVQIFSCYLQDALGDILFSFTLPAYPQINCPAWSQDLFTIRAHESLRYCLYAAIEKNSTTEKNWKNLNSQIRMRISGNYKLNEKTFDFQSNSCIIKERVKDSLLLDLSLEKQELSIGESINATVSILNFYNYSVNVTEMGLTILTLDFEIYTPDDKTLHYCGAVKFIRPGLIKIEPGEKYSTVETLCFQTFYNNFGYNLTTVGEYTIKAIYNSTGDKILESLESNIESFTIVQ